MRDLRIRRQPGKKERVLCHMKQEDVNFYRGVMNHNWIAADCGFCYHWDALWNVSWKSLFTSNCVALSNFVVEELGVLSFVARLTRADMRNWYFVSFVLSHQLVSCKPIYFRKLTRQFHWKSGYSLIRNHSVFHPDRIVRYLEKKHVWPTSFSKTLYFVTGYLIEWRRWRLLITITVKVKFIIW